MLYLNPKSVVPDSKSGDFDDGSLDQSHQESVDYAYKRIKKSTLDQVHQSKRSKRNAYFLEPEELECSSCKDVFDSYSKTKRDSDSGVIVKTIEPVVFDSEILIEGCKTVASDSKRVSKKEKRESKRMSEGAVASLTAGQWALSLGFWIASTVVPSIVDSYPLIYFQDGLLPTTAFVVSSSFFLSYFPYLSHNVKVLPYGLKTVRRKDGFTRWFIMADLSLKARSRIEKQMEKQAELLAQPENR